MSRFKKDLYNDLIDIIFLAYIDSEPVLCLNRHCRHRPPMWQLLPLSSFALIRFREIYERKLATGKHCLQMDMRRKVEIGQKLFLKYY